MRLCLLVLGCVIAASAWPVDQHSVRVHGINGWFVPQRDGGLRWIGKAEAERQLEYYEAQEALEGRLSTNTVNFYLYTQQNPSDGQQIKATQASIDASNFNPENPTRITIHGWNSNYKDGVNTRVAAAWFQYGDYNMIAVDWSRGRSLEYATSVAGASGAGKKIAALVDFLVEGYGMRLDTLEIVGFSLGAHVAGYTAKQVASGKVGKVVGLDPASPLISYSKTAKRLSSDDALYVESIQTNGAVLGFSQPIGKAAFYMNGGKSQPGCGIDITGSCSHTKAVLYYVEALLWNNFPSKKCETYKDANKNTCADTYSSVLMGANINSFVAEGIFYVPVNKDSPYGFGEVNGGEEVTTAAPAVTTTVDGEDETTTEVSTSTTADKPEETTTKEPEEDSTTTETSEDSSSTTEKPEDSSTTTEEPEDSTTEAPEEDNTTTTPKDEEVESTTEEPEEVSTTTKAPEEPEETTSTPEEIEDTTTEEVIEDSTTAAPQDDDTTVPSDDSTTEEPEKSSTSPNDNEVSTTEEPEETSTSPNDNEVSTTEEPEEVSTTPKESEESTTTTPEDDNTTSAPGDGEDDDTTAAPGGGEEESTTEDPEENSTTPDETEDSTTDEPEEETTTSEKPVEPSTTTEEPEESTTEVSEDTTTEEPDNNTPLTENPEETSSTTAEQEVSTTVEPDVDSTVDPEDDQSTSEDPEEVSTTDVPTELPAAPTTIPTELPWTTTTVPIEIPSTTGVPPEVPITTLAPELPITTLAPELPLTTLAPEVPPPKDGSTKNIFIFNVFLVNVKIENKS
ncbi:location of vulva defective 1 [Drosophila teissieri]|uniref:location of vulva defective 1 n=1 Tax=Drosophila teissieri TaxID=7243 RepID=UPI001CB9F527|nr:location of vulva defective 1 [Drosophila teissieri]